MEGLSGSASGWAISTEVLLGVVEGAFLSICRRHARIGSAIFLQVLRTHIFKGDIDLAADLTLRVVGDADAARLRDPLQARSDVDAVAKDIIVIDDDVTDVNADAELDPVVLRHVGILPGHAALDFNRKARRIDGTGEFDEHAVAGRLDYPSAMRGDGGIDQGPS